MVLEAVSLVHDEVAPLARLEEARLHDGHLEGGDHDGVHHRRRLAHATQAAVVANQTLATLRIAVELQHRQLAGQTWQLTLLLIFIFNLRLFNVAH